MYQIVIFDSSNLIFDDCHVLVFYMGHVVITATILCIFCVIHCQVHLSCLTEILNNFARILPQTPSMKPTFASLLVFLYYHIPAQRKYRT